MSDALIDEAAAGFVALQKKGGMAAVKMGLDECWENTFKKKSVEGAVYCSAFNFAATKFDETAVAAMGYPPSLSTGEATARSRKALLAAGVHRGNVVNYVLVIQQKAILSYTKAMRNK